MVKIHLFHLAPYALVRAACHVWAGRLLCRKHGARLRDFVPDSINGMTAAWNLSQALEGRPRPRALIDVGANRSQVAKLLQLICEPEAPVLSFEPIPGLPRIGTPYPLALSDRDGREDFYIPVGDGELGSLHKDYADNLDRQAKVLSVETARFDSLVKQGRVPWTQLPRPRLLKVDTEGHDLQALAGFGDCLHEVDYIMTEVSNAEGRGRHYDWIDMARVLSGYGFNHSRVMYACYDGWHAPAYLDVLFWREGTAG